MDRRTALGLLAQAGAAVWPGTRAAARAREAGGTAPAQGAPPPVPSVTCGPLQSTQAPPAGGEPCVATASTWWAPQRNVWTPIGWKDHLFRFNVLYNGTVLCEPCPALMPPRPHARPYQGQDLQLVFAPTPDGKALPLPQISTRLYHLDGGFGVQGWREDRRTPVLWTEWPLQEGVVLRQEIFAYTPGARPVETGVEPLYAWIRLSVVHVDAIRAPEKTFMSLQLSKVYYKHLLPWKFEDGVTLEARPSLADWPGELRNDRGAAPADHTHGGAANGDATASPASRSAGAGVRAGVRVIEPDGRVRLAVPAATAAGPLLFGETRPGSRVYNVSVELPARVGARTDILAAMLPQQAGAFDAVLSTGFDRALEACEPYWSDTPATAARVRTPEAYVDKVIARNLQFAEVVAEKNPETKEYTFLTGSYGYDCLWSTPVSMTSHMLLDLLGYHDTVERHVDLYRHHQGANVAPGPSYKAHPGYFSTPRSLQAFDWASDHGAVLHLVSYHALLTGDARFTATWLPHVVKACDFIKDSCAIADHDGVKGLMPPAVATDELVATQAVWTLGWAYKGLASAVRLLARERHPRAGEFEAFAARYQSTFAAAYRDVAARGKSWTAPDGSVHPMPHAYLTETKRHIFADLTLLDTGPLFHVWAGLMDARDPLMQSALRFFREGPNWRFYGYRANPLDRAVLVHEQSSGEPCYSWNIPHAWQLGDRARFLEGMYGLLTGAISPQTYIGGEHRHGMYGNLCPQTLMTWSLRHAVVDDAVVPGEVHLLRLCPLAWISSEEETQFEQMPTEHGPVNVRVRQADRQTLEVRFSAAWHHAPRRVLLHVPPLAGATRMRINGKLRDAKPGVPIEL